jgi:hypothetical protein
VSKASKRAHGRGRMPQGPFKAKSANFSTRITPETRAELDRLAQAKGHSLSQEVEILLREVISTSRDTPAHIQALERAVTLLAKDIERRTGKQWNEDQFTGDSLRHGIEALLLNLAPQSHVEVVVPPLLEQVAAKSHPLLRESLRNPLSFGRLHAEALTMAIESAPLATNEPPGMFYPAPSGLSYIRENIGSGAQVPRTANKETKR